jgi:hypothetical protein
MLSSGLGAPSASFLFDSMADSTEPQLAAFPLCIAMRKGVENVGSKTTEGKQYKR